ncbi:MAG: amidohydrolase family protein [Alphaproteobacteria bacterium]
MTQQPTPKFTPPAGACDCHVHVYGPPSRFPFVESHRERSPDGPASALETMHKSIGVERCVIVHPPDHGTDLAVIIDAMQKGGREYRAVALVEPTITDERLEELDGLGFRGIRYSPTLDGGTLDRPAVLEMARRIEPLGWHLLLHFKDNAVVEYADLLEAIPVPFILDHFGGVDPATGGTAQDSFRIVADHISMGRGWIKTSAIEKISHQSYPFKDAVELAAAFVDLAPDRVIWGTDWPHPGVGKQATDDVDLLDLIPLYAPDAETRHKILVDNPARLYGF